MEQKNINYIVLAFVFLIIGAVLIVQIAENTNEKTSKTVVYDETYDLSALGCVNETEGGTINGTNDADCNLTVTYAPTGWELYDANSCPLTNVVVNNGSTAVANLVEGIDYNAFLDVGLIQMLNTTDTDEAFYNTTVIDYAYCGDEYLNSSWGRTILSLVSGFIALAMLGISLWLFYNVFASVGILKR